MAIYIKDKKLFFKIKFLGFLLAIYIAYKNRTGQRDFSKFFSLSKKVSDKYFIAVGGEILCPQLASYA